MSKKDNLFTTTLRLNLNNAQDMEAWNNLMSADSTQPEYSSYCRTIVTAINDHFARQDRIQMVCTPSSSASYIMVVAAMLASCSREL